jgi:TrmH family RNA methyltransferase
MLSKAQVKYIRSLRMQKYRKAHQVFVAEGEKIAQECLQAAAPIQMIVATQAWQEKQQALIACHPEASLHAVLPSELEQISTLQTPHEVLLVVPMPKISAALPTERWVLALDRLQDPGNLGTIIRIADWFGIAHIVCSPDTADAYNPKVIQAAMGGHLRVQIHYTELAPFLATTRLPVFAATLDGENIYTVGTTQEGILLIGNESKGVAPELQALATQKITIPRLGGAESLNAGVSAGIICALMMRGLLRHPFVF